MHLFTFRNISRTQCRDAAFALILIGLILHQFMEMAWIIPALIVFTLLVMIWPRIVSPFAVFWFGLSEALGAVMSRVILTILFFGLVTPIGLARRLAGKDPMQEKRWMDGQKSAFTVRGDVVCPQDLERPF